MSMSYVTLFPPSRGDSEFIYVYSWVPKPVSDEQAFEAIKAGLDILPADAKLILNSGTRCNGVYENSNHSMPLRL